MPMRTVVILRRLALALAVIGLGVAAWQVDLGAILAAGTGYAEWVKTQGVLGGAAFCVAFIAWSLVLPKGPFVLLAGFVYGLGLGLTVTYLAATVVIVSAFWIARSLGRRRAAAWMERRPWLAACDRALGAQGGRIVFLLRMSPLIPSQVQNYLYGLSQVPFGKCLIASWLGMLPFTAVWVAVGATAGPDSLMGATDGLGWTIPVGIVFGIAALALIAWQARRTLRAAGVVAAPIPGREAA